MKKILLLSCLCLFAAHAFGDDVRVGIFIHSPNVLLDAQTQKPVGPTIDYITEVLRKMGHTPIFLILPFPRIISSLESGDIDLTLEISKNQDRERIAYFSKNPVYIMRPGITVLRENALTKIGTIDDLKGMTIGFLSGAATSEFFANQSVVKFELVASDNWLAINLEKLIAKRFEAVFDQNLYSYLAEAKLKNMQDKIKTIPLPVKGTEAYIAFSKKSSKGQRLVQEFDRINTDKPDVVNTMIEAYLKK